MGYIVSIIKRTLLRYNIVCDTKGVTEILLSDNAYPSALALIRTLYYYGIKAEAYKSDFKSFAREDKTKIVHCASGEGHFYFVENITNSNIILYDGEKHLIGIDSFRKLWDGIVIVIEGKKGTKTSRKTSNKFIEILMLVSLTLLSISLCKDIPSLFQMLIDYVGLFFSLILAIKDSYTNINIPFCHIGKYFNCNVVSNYNPFFAKFPLELPFVGIMYFIFDVLALLLGVSLNILFIVSFLGTLCSVYLLGYQIFYIRKCCIFCIIVGFCFIVKMILLVLTCKMFTVWTISMFQESLFCFICATTIATIICKSIKIGKEKEESTISALSIKRVPQLFWKISRSGKEVEMPVQPSLSFGMGNNIKIDTIIELGCKHCQKAIDVLTNIVEKYNDFVTWNIYLFMPTSNAKEKNRAALELMELYKGKKENIFLRLKKHDFSNYGIEISEETIMENENIQNFLRNKSVKYFPSIAINNKLFPHFFDIKDLDILISDWIYSVENL